MTRRAPGQKRSSSVIGRAAVMKITSGHDYPRGTPGEFAACFFFETEAHWGFISGPTRAAAEKEFLSILRRSDVHRVPSSSRPGAVNLVAWIAECQPNGTTWLRIKETQGAKNYLNEDE